MAFFGLTALGPQSSFASAEKHYRHVQIFDDDDFINAWNKVIGSDKNMCISSKIEEILKKIYKGQVPLCDRSDIEQCFSEYSNIKTTISKDEFIKIMINLRNKAENEMFILEGKPKPTCEFSSVEHLQHNIATLRPFNQTLQEKQTMPLTASQEIGWQQPDSLELPRHGRGQSEITKFASELIKNGIYY